MRPIDQDQLYQDALTVLGVRRNHLKLIEESAELGAAVARLLLGTSENDDDMLTEAVDVWLCIEIERRRIGEERWNEVLRQRLQRLAVRVLAATPEGQRT